MLARFAFRLKRLLGLLLKGAIVGAFAGVGAAGFFGFLALVHNLAFLGTFSFAYDSSVHTPTSPWGPWVILVPVAGAIGVSFLITTFAMEAKGHGVPEVMEAIHFDRGVIRPVVSIIKALASGLSIGTGGAVGREGPMAQIGAGFGSTVGQWLKLPPWQRVTLAAAGAGAGIAATFNTPVGGMLFAVELMLTEVSADTLLTVGLATTVATLLRRALYSSPPAFTVPPVPHVDLVIGPPQLLLYLVFGIVLGLASVLYIRAIYALEDVFERVPGGYYVRHGLGMLVVGVLMWAFMATSGHYYVQGVGYATVQDIFDGRIVAPVFLLLLFAAKLLTTTLTLGSGASGGIFSPALFMGAAVGEVFGLAARSLFPQLPISPLPFAVVGMAGVIGGSTGAVMTAITMVFEMTRDYSIVIPMIVTVVMAHAVRRLFLGETIYTLKSKRRKKTLPLTLISEMMFAKAADVVAERKVAWVASDRTIARALSDHPDARAFLVGREGGEPEGVVLHARAVEAAAESGSRTVGDLAEKFLWLEPGHRLRWALGQMERRKIAVGLVRTPDGIGVVSRESLLRATEDALHLVARE